MANLDDDLIELRREIHRHPELAGEERETAMVNSAELSTGWQPGRSRATAAGPGPET